MARGVGLGLSLKRPLEGLSEDLTGIFRVYSKWPLRIELMVLNFKHPSDVNLSYIEHLMFTWKESARAFIAALVMFIHGIFPPLLDWWYSEYIKKAKRRIDNLNECRNETD